MEPLLRRKLSLLLMCAAGAQLGLAQVTVGFPEPHNLVTLSVPDKPAALRIDLLHLKVQDNQLDKSATRRKIQASDGQGWVFSAFMYPLDKKQNATELREEAFSTIRKTAAENGFKLDEMKTYERAGFSMREYLIPEFRGQPVHQKNVFGYITSGDMGFDFHISKISYSANDDNFLDSLLSGVRIIEDYKPDGGTEFGYGSIFYLRQDWKTAAAHYERALELEKQRPVLSPTQRTVLVDNLGMAYGMAGDISKAKGVFEYGIYESPTYPMFRYNLACADSELEIWTARLISSGIRWITRIPVKDSYPAKDDSFERYFSDPRFIKLTKELCPSSTRTEAGWQCK